MELLAIIIRKWIIPGIVMLVLGAVWVATTVYAVIIDNEQRQAKVTPPAPPVYTDDDLHY